ESRHQWFEGIADENAQRDRDQKDLAGPEGRDNRQRRDDAPSPDGAVRCRRCCLRAITLQRGAAVAGLAFEAHDGLNVPELWSRRRHRVTRLTNVRTINNGATSSTLAKHARLSTG